MLSRRDVGKLALGLFSLPAVAAKKIDSVVNGVQFGLQSYVYYGIGLPAEGILDVVLNSMVECGLGECDLYGPLLEPALLWDKIRAAGGGGASSKASPEVAAAAARATDELAHWRKSVSLDYFAAIRKRFEDAGIEIYGLSGLPGATEEELNRTFEIAKVLGASLVTLTISMSDAKRVAPFADKHNFLVGIQGRPDMTSTNPDMIAKPESFKEMLALSKRYCVSFDIGNATGGGFDSVKFVEDQHDRISLIYLKDRRKDKLSVPWGQGDTPIKDVLRMIKDRKYPIRCYIDCDYKTTNRPADIKQSFEYSKAALS